MITVNFIGCGHLGKTLAKLIANNHLGHILGILTSSVSSAQLAAEYIGQGNAVPEMSLLPSADIYFITTPDDLIERICEQLISQAPIKENAIIIHCSGSLSSEVLKSAGAKGYKIMSLHPLKSFAIPDNALQTFSGTHCAYEGNEEALPLINYIFKNLGAHLYPIKKEQKTLYHIASIMAANHLIGLHSLAVRCYVEAGFETKLATQLTSQLMQATINNITQSGYSAALSGPVRRGDVHMIKQHLTSLASKPLIGSAYQTLGQVTMQYNQQSQSVNKSLENLFQQTTFNLKSDL